MARKLGLKPHTHDERDIKLTSVYNPTSALPSDFGASGLDWGMLGNDRWGDCYWASAAHETMAEAHLSGRTRTFSERSVLDTYATYLGLYGLVGLEAKPSADEGTDAREGAKFRRTHGVLDGRGMNAHIGAYAFIEDPDYDLIKSAVRDFEGVTVCVEFPQSADEAFNRAEGGLGPYVWDYTFGSEIVGGHAVAGTSVRADKLMVVSWGREVEVTEAFIEKYLQCVVVYVTGSTLDGEGKTVNGLDISALREKLAALR